MTYTSAIHHIPFREGPVPAQTDAPSLASIARRPDEHLLRDIGLTREEAMGPAAWLWHDWNRIRAQWSL